MGLHAGQGHDGVTGDLTSDLADILLQQGFTHIRIVSGPDGKAFVLSRHRSYLNAAVRCLNGYGKVLSLRKWRQEQQPGGMTA